MVGSIGSDLGRHFLASESVGEFSFDGVKRIGYFVA